MKLTLRQSDILSDWYVIERAEHDGAETMVRPSTASRSSRRRAS